MSNDFGTLAFALCEGVTICFGGAMNKDIQFAINQIEMACANRHMSPVQRGNITEYVCKALFLSEEYVAQVLLLPVFAELNTRQAVANTLLVTMPGSMSADAEEVLRLREKAMRESKEFATQYDWFTYVQTSHDPAEVGIYLAASKIKRGVDALCAEVAGGNLRLLWLALGMAIAFGEEFEAHQADLLATVVSLYQMGIVEYCNEAMVARLEELRAKGYNGQPLISPELCGGKVGF